MDPFPAGKQAGNRVKKVPTWKGNAKKKTLSPSLLFQASKATIFSLEAVTCPPPTPSPAEGERGREEGPLLGIFRCPSFRSFHFVIINFSDAAAAPDTTPPRSQKYKPPPPLTPHRQEVRNISRRGLFRRHLGRGSTDCPREI